ncbi:unnamed protein product [Acanthoscelides obtectus]|uniref:Uncharacterized protein n=1 Tax=Acanthoscelides obtectus TaxID=200917 RepID=A0A9P0KV73_ACAOB|nr:unnamed protein product [Acanthoscelides obtectus]CAK1622197.1 hypothetical protein AOBTE_LOCUS1365 [Acanthoscelides obtectus]
MLSSWKNGTYIRIDRPKDDPNSYLNRKHFYSIQLFVIIEHKSETSLLDTLDQSVIAEYSGIHHYFQFCVKTANSMIYWVIVATHVQDIS